MKPNFCYIVLILDRSTSMSSVQSATIESYNTILQKQKEQPGEAAITLVQFADDYTLQIDGTPLKDAPPLTKLTYRPQGNTALDGAIGRTIDHVGIKLAALPEDQRPSQVLFTILTDGEENWTTEVEWARPYANGKAAAMIKHQQEKYNWEFTFIGANQDVRATAQRLNIDANNAMQFDQSAVGMAAMSEEYTKGLTNYRGTGVARSGGRGFFNTDDK